MWFADKNQEPKAKGQELTADFVYNPGSGLPILLVIFRE
jgi:hypothetical protein